MSGICKKELAILFWRLIHEKICINICETFTSHSSPIILHLNIILLLLDHFQLKLTSYEFSIIIFIDLRESVNKVSYVFFHISRISPSVDSCGIRQAGKDRIF